MYIKRPTLPDPAAIVQLQVPPILYKSCSSAHPSCFGLLVGWLIFFEYFKANPEHNVLYA